jgi:GTP cyclohydrolase I
MQAAVRAFLSAAGLDPKSHPELAQTPSLVARTWAEELLDGYRSDPHQILAERMPAGVRSHDELIVLERLAYQSVCPHHLLPYGGLAHVAYVPGRTLVGFGQIVRLLDCLSHRLMLQEDLGKEVAEVLMRELGAKAAGVLLESEQACMALRGGRRNGSRVVTEAFAGKLARDPELRGRFLEAARMP